MAEWRAGTFSPFSFCLLGTFCGFSLPVKTDIEGPRDSLSRDPCYFLVFQDAGFNAANGLLFARPFPFRSARGSLVPSGSGLRGRKEKAYSGPGPIFRGSLGLQLLVFFLRRSIQAPPSMKILRGRLNDYPRYWDPLRGQKRIPMCPTLILVVPSRRTQARNGRGLAVQGGTGEGVRGARGPAHEREETRRFCLNGSLGMIARRNHSTRLRRHPGNRAV